MIIQIDRILEVEKYLENVEAVIFDLDDTLYSETEYVRSGYEMIAREFPNIENMQEKLWQAFKQKKMAINEVLHNEGIFNDETLTKCLNIYRNHKPSIHLYEGVQELLTRLKACGKKVGIITDGRPEGQRAKIESLGLKQIVDYILITDELGGIEFRKPNDKSFCIMSDVLGTSFENMVYIGDNPNKDFVAPEKLNMKSIWFRNKEGIYYTESQQY